MNITISVDDEVGRWAKIWAAKNESSVSRLVSEILTEKMELDSRYEAAMDEFMSRCHKAAPISNEPYLSREEIHER